MKIRTTYILVVFLLCAGCTSFPYIQVNKQSTEVTSEVSVFFEENGFSSQRCTREELNARFRLHQYTSVDFRDGFSKSYASSIFPQKGFIKACTAVADSKYYVFVYTGGMESEVENIVNSLEKRLAVILPAGAYVRGSYADATL